MRLPLYVSYVFHSIGADRGWRHIDAQTELQLTFVYNTAKMWNQGIGSLMSADAGSIEGSLFPSSMKIINNRLVVQFRTEARFSGQFVINHEGILQFYLEDHVYFYIFHMINCICVLKSRLHYHNQLFFGFLLTVKVLILRVYLFLLILQQKTHKK